MTELLLVASYLLGSVSFAILVARGYGLPDPRKHGSGNPGATNMLRTGRKSAAALTLLGDAFKGYLAVWLAQWASTAWGLPAYTPYLAALAGLTVATWAIVFALTRISSLSALVAAALAPFYGWLLLGSSTETGLLALLCALVLARHHGNIRKLLSGEEAAFKRR